MSTWLLYGANGYTGRLIAEEAARRGLRPILAGRDRTSVGEVAGRYGFEARTFFWQCPGCLTWDSYPPQRIETL